MSVVRQQEMISKQQLALAKEKYDQGLVLFNDKRYAESVPLFEESFHLNPSSDETANYLKLAQQEQQTADEAKRARSAQTRLTTTTSHGTTTTGASGTAGHLAGTDTSRPANVAPAQITTFFNNSAVTDGFIRVKMGATIVAEQNLWEEKERFFHRKYHANHVVNVTKDVTPANADIEIWVVIPAMQIQEHHTMRANFQPGSAHRLIVTFDAQSKKFDYQLN